MRRGEKEKKTGDEKRGEEKKTGEIGRAHV